LFEILSHDVILVLCASLLCGLSSTIIPLNAIRDDQRLTHEPSDTIASVDHDEGQLPMMLPYNERRSNNPAVVDRFMRQTMKAV
jgi:hypothetical protein